jgi:hypothetical protein
MYLRVDAYRETCCVFRLLALLLFLHLLTLKEKPQEHSEMNVVELLSPYACSIVLVIPYTCPPVRERAFFLALVVQGLAVEAGNLKVVPTNDGMTPKAHRRNRGDGPPTEANPPPNLRRGLVAMQGVPEEKKRHKLGDHGLREQLRGDHVYGLRELRGLILRGLHARGLRDSPADEQHKLTRVRELHTQQPARMLRPARTLRPVDALPQWSKPADALQRLLEPADARYTPPSAVLLPAAAAVAAVAVAAAAAELQPERLRGCSSSAAAAAAAAAVPVSVRKPLLTAALEQCTPLSGALAHGLKELQRDVSPFLCFRRCSSLSLVSNQYFSSSMVAVMFAACCYDLDLFRSLLWSRRCR